MVKNELRLGNKHNVFFYIIIKDDRTYKTMYDAGCFFFHYLKNKGTVSPRSTNTINNLPLNSSDQYQTAPSDQVFAL